MIIPNSKSAREKEYEYFSDSTLTNYSTYTNELFTRRPYTGNANKDRSKKTYVKPKKSLSQFLEKKRIFSKKSKGDYTKNMYSPGGNMFKPPYMASTYGKAGGDNVKNGTLDKKFVYHQTATVGDASVANPQAFPFKSTPSGHYKLNPSQIVYESKNLSIVAADPNSVSLNITESDKAKEDQEKKPVADNWTTTCLYTTVGKGDLTYSDIESTTDSDHATPTAELSLAKMGYVTDNWVEWKDLELPKKSDLKKALLHNILNIINPDVQVKVGDKTHSCHRIVLQCYCTFFTSKTSPQVQISKTDMPGDVFPLIYQWMLHLGSDSYRLLRRDNILFVLKAAQYLGIKELDDQCWAFIDNTEVFFEDAAFLLYVEARRLDNKLVMEQMVPRVQRFFLTLVSSKEFVEFSVDEVCTFLSSSCISVHCEEEVFMSGVRWLRYDWSERKTHAVRVMSCIRFGHLNVQTLLALRKDLGSPEFVPVIQLPEVGKMLDDGLSIQVVRLCLKDESMEHIQISTQSLNLQEPAPRNWAGREKEKCFQSYASFLKDLAHYRTQQRLEIKKSKIKMQMEKVEKDDFLSSAVLPPDTQQKLSRMCAKGSGSFSDCLPQLQARDLSVLRDMVRRGSVSDEDRRRVKKHLISMVSEPQQVYNLRECCAAELNQTAYEQDMAARKIQKAYRSHSAVRRRTMIRSSLDLKQDQAARKIQKAYRNYSARRLSDGSRQSAGRPHPLYRGSRSDPSLPSSLTKSSVHPRGKYDKDLLPLRVEQRTVFIFGGSNPFDESDKNGSCIFYYDTEGNEWRNCGQMPEPRHYHSAVYFQGRIYIAGGKNPYKELSEKDAISRTVWRYDPHHKKWSQIEDMHSARRSFGLVGCSNKLYVIGGRNEQDRIIANCEMFDTVSNSWLPIAPLRLARAGAAISDFKNKIWVAGGLIEGPYVATNRVEVYDCQRNMWSEVTGMRYTLAYGAMVPVNNRLFIVGGAVGLQHSALHGSGRQIDIWDEESQDWGLASLMCKPRHAHAAVYLRSSPETGYMFIMGGMSAKHHTVIDTVECWRIQDEQWIHGIAPLPSRMSGSAALVLPPDTFS